MPSAQPGPCATSTRVNETNETNAKTPSFRRWSARGRGRVAFSLTPSLSRARAAASEPVRDAARARLAGKAREAALLTRASDA
jgi:hypothetical protein